MQRLWLPQGPAQGLCLLLEGAVEFPREPELELNAGIGFLQEDLGGGSGTREWKSELRAHPPCSDSLLLPCPSVSLL